MKNYTLRPYQETALTDLIDWLERHNEGNPIVDACVGAGKSVIIAEFCKRAIAQYPDTRIVMCVASKELCQQNLEKLRTIWPEAPAGVCSASLGQKDLESQIVFATIGSIAKHAHNVGVVNILIIDECHNVNPDNAGMYREFINDLKQYGSPYLCVIGFTGTPFRGDGIWLWQGKDPLFAGTATRISMDDLLKLGFLAPLVVDTNTPQTIDTTSVKVAGTDYVVKDLENVAIDPEVIQATIADLCSRGYERRKWLIFCVTIEHAQIVMDALQEKCKASRQLDNLNPAIVTSKTSNLMRSDMLTRYKLPHNYPSAINCLVNVACLTTGFDAPETDLIALLRPTKSPVLYVQIAGRGMRIAEGKTDCLWLDYTSTTRESGPVNLIKGRNRLNSGNGGGEAPFKYCPECGNPNPIHAIECVECGEPIPASVNQIHNTNASTALPLHGYQPLLPTTFEVEQIGYYKHVGKKGIPMLRIDYHCKGEPFPISEFKCFEHEGFALRMACQWWNDNLPVYDVPLTVDEALEIIHNPAKHDPMLPTKIECKKDPNDPKGKYWQVKKCIYEAKEKPKVISGQPLNFKQAVFDDVPF